MRASVTLNRCSFILAACAGLTIVVSITTSARAEEVEPRERVILMQSGRVLTGFASRNAGGWLVEQSNGRVQIPLDQVNVVADSLVDAYRQQRDSVVEPTPATHMALAQWCISYRLHNEARDEVRKCLKLDKDHTAALKLLRRLDDILDPNAGKPVPSEIAPRRSKDGFLVPEAESLGGLTTEAAATYVQRIQPLLINKCGNTSCHASTATREKSDGFRLIPTRPGTNSHRIYAERNLAAVMRYIDLQDPEQSQLLTIPAESHGGSANVFHGSGGSTQIKMLRAWVNTVADEKRAAEEAISNRPKLVEKVRRAPVETPSAAITRVGESAKSVKKASRTDEFTSNHSLASLRPTPVAEESEDSSKAKVSTTTGNRPSSDPFDPDVFNRRFHTTPRR